MKYAYGSGEWLAAMHGVMLGRMEAFRKRASAEEIAAIAFSMAEIALDPPPHIAGGAPRVGWRCDIADGELRFRTDDLDGATFRVIAPYGVFNALSSFDTSGGSAREQEYAALQRQAAESGALRTEGTPSRGPREFLEIHNIMARVTA